MAFSIDLEKRVVAVDGSRCVDEAEKVFKVRQKAIYYWLMICFAVFFLVHCTEKIGYIKLIFGLVM